MNKNGFTMVELLVAMAIMGLLMIMAFPTMRAVQLNNEKKKYSSYEESVLSAVKLYADSYSEDLFDPSIKNQYKIIYLSEIQKKGLLKDINISDSSCINGESNVTIVKYNNDYSYCLHLKCTNKNDSSTKLYETEDKKGSCSTFSKVNVTYKYKNNSKTYEVINGDDSYRLLSPSEVGFDEFLQNDQVKFDKWNKGNIGDLVTIDGNTIIEANTHSFNYKIKYVKSNNDITNSTADTNCTVGVKCNLRENGFTYNGYTFEKWYQSSNNKEYAAGDDVQDTIGKSITRDNEVVTLTTRFRINKVYVHLYANGGDFATTYNNKYTKDNKGKISYSKNDIIHTINYNDKIGSSGLTNYNNSKYLNLEKTGYRAKTDAEWNTSSKGTGTSFDQDTDYKAEELCSNIDKGDCNINLYVDWVITKPNDPKITNTNNDKWVKDDYKITISTTTDKSIIGDWYYSTDNKKFTPYSSSNGKTSITPKMTVDAGKLRNNTLYVKVCNKNAKNASDTSNCSNVKSTKIKIDKEAPSCGKVENPGTSEVRYGTTFCADDKWRNGKQTITQYCNDGNGSGCKNEKYSKTYLRNIEWNTNPDGTKSFHNPTDAYTDEVVIKDTVGNKKTCEFWACVDNCPPQTPRLTSTGFNCDNNTTTYGNINCSKTVNYNTTVSFGYDYAVGGYSRGETYYKFSQKSGSCSWDSGWKSLDYESYPTKCSGSGTTTYTYSYYTKDKAGNSSGILKIEITWK